jgi:hypothetical protein
MDANGVITKGRQVSGLSRLIAPDFASEVSIGDRYLTVRVDDGNAPEFWLEFNIPVETIKRLLMEVGHQFGPYND